MRANREMLPYQCQSVAELPESPEYDQLTYQWTFGIPQGKRLAEVQGFITRPEFPLSRSRLERMESLVVISAYGTGYDYIDVEAASDLGILVTHTPIAVVESTAQLGLTLILALLRQIFPHDRMMRSNPAQDDINVGFVGKKALTHEAKSQVVGLVGYGRVARRLGQLLRGVGFQVMYTRQHGMLAGHPGYHELPELLRGADFVVVLTPLTEDTIHLIGEKELKTMKTTAFLVNISRGRCVNEEALTRCLLTGCIAGAALDVFEDEPRVPEELTHLSTVILSPHVGTQTWEARVQMTHDAMKNIEQGLLGIAQNSVNEECWSRQL